MASALLKMRSIKIRIGQRCDQRIDAQPRTMRSRLFGAYSVTPPGGSCWALLDIWPHAALVAVKGFLNGPLFGSCCAALGIGKLAGQDVRPHEGEAGTQAGQWSGAVTGISEQNH